MKIAVISDTHDNIPNIKKILTVINERKIAAIIHCGDIATRDTVEFLSKNFSGELYFVSGNMDDPKLIRGFPTFPSCHYFGETGELNLSGLKIGFCHQPERAKKLAEETRRDSSSFDVIFYGHTHKPWEENYQGIQLLNPGTAAGLFYKAAFAIYDSETRKAELVALEKIFGGSLEKKD